MTLQIDSTTSSDEDLQRAVRDDWRTHGYKQLPETPEEPSAFRTARALRPGEPEPKAKSEAERVEEAWQRQVKDRRAKEPDFDETINESKVQITPALREAIKRSDVGAELMEYYARHPAEARSLLEHKDGGVAAAKRRAEGLKSPSMKEYMSTRERQTGRKGNRI